MGSSQISRSTQKPPKRQKLLAMNKLANIGKSEKCRKTTYMISKDKSPAVERANVLMENLGNEFPSFVKPMLPSHVAGGFWLSLTRPFCTEHLPNHDCTMMLEDESGIEYAINYLVNKNGLSGGWRGFSIAHQLVEGDALVFQLVELFKMKVYIVRSNSYGKAVNGSAPQWSNAFEKIEIPSLKNIDAPAIVLDDEGDCEETGLSDIVAPTIDLIPSDDCEGLRFSESVMNFKLAKNVENFNIHVNGLIMDSEVSKHVRGKYYELCLEQNSLLHDHLLAGLNYKLVVGVISETVNIADAVRVPNAATMSRDDSSIWDKTLEAFEMLGMNVRFLRDELKAKMELKDKKK